jgi:hypothetical protein
MSTGNRWVYVVVYSGVSREQITAVLDRYEDKFPDWLSMLPQTVFVVSSLTAKGVSEFLRGKLSGLSRLLVLDANTDRNGWMPEKAWEFLRKSS